MTVVLTLTEGEDCNIHLPTGPLSVELVADSSHNYTLIKKDVTKDFGELKIDIKVLGKATRPGYWPRQFITEIEQKQEDDKVSSDEEEDSTEAYY